MVLEIKDQIRMHYILGKLFGQTAKTLTAGKNIYICQFNTNTHFPDISIIDLTLMQLQYKYISHAASELYTVDGVLSCLVKSLALLCSAALNWCQVLLK